MSNGYTRERLVGALESIRLERDGFLIGALRGGKAIKGDLDSPLVGRVYELHGRWVNDPKYGRQFQFDDVSIVAPTGKAAVIEYLISNCEGVGPKIAKKMVKVFGDDTLRMAREEPSLVLAKVPAMTSRVAQKMKLRLKSLHADEADKLRFSEIFSGTGVSKRAVRKVRKLWGKDAIKRIEKDPYALIWEFHGIGFKKADKVAERVGYAREGVPRIRAGIDDVLREAARSGDCCLQTAKLLTKAAGLLGLAEALVREGLEEATNSDDVVVEGDVVYLPDIHENERFVAERLLLMALQKLPMGQPDLDMLQDDQVEAVLKAAQSSVFVLTGAPGTGKTFAIKRILNSFPKSKTLLAAPTGKAAKRMEEMTGQGAQTIHKLLETRPGDDGGFDFARGENNPVEADLVVIDEASMIDISLMADLLRAIGRNTRLIFVGDSNQLPSIGPGNVLQDILDSGVVPATELTMIKRQDAGLIVRNCHRVKDGQSLEIENEDGSDFFFINKNNPDAINETIYELLTDRLPAKYGLDPWTDIQVIAPSRDKDGMSCKVLNEMFQSRWNDHPMQKNLRLKTGDKVIQTRNDYKTEVMNGEIGRVVGIDTRSDLLSIAMENPRRTVGLPVFENDLQLAYAITCHRFQGSEAPAIIIPLHSSMSSFLLQRSWLYTAISRAKQICVLVGQPEVAGQAISRVKAQHRVTRLKERLQ